MKRKNYNRYGVYFVIPFFLVFLAFSLFPIVYTFYLSVTNTKGFSGNMGDFVGLQNYVHIMTPYLILDDGMKDALVSLYRR